MGTLPESKVCCKCGAEKASTEFHRHRGGRLKARCKACRAIEWRDSERRAVRVSAAEVRRETRLCPSGTKRCSKCHVVKSVEAFPMDRTHKDGRRTSCCDCGGSRPSPQQYLFYTAKARAKRKGLEFAITQGDIAIPEACPVLGIRLQPGRGRSIASSPTLDRIDSSKGYLPGNVRVISFRANTLKNCGTLEDHERLVAWMKRAGAR